ncbi:MAG TPA: exodeoxyribonuclease VII large subunit [Solimonas sp.]|nr:exodeoxyribonuclease VII large subunit [Solimonas sp.]
MQSATKKERTIYQVAELAEALRGLIDSALPRVWVQGEISNFSRPASGHWYFTLKDAQAQLRCVMFKGQNFLVRPAPREGDSVLVRAQIGLYAARGDLQLICEHLEPAGEGALLRAFEQLKSRLAAEGLFAEAIKRPLPSPPRAIGVITSASGAALHDITTTLARRCALLRVFLYPVPVQGAEAAPAIVRALQELPRRARVDLVILARGGGSLEDLWAFNEESVARAIRACSVPVVTGVGHEVDFTIADFAADRRAATPTAAAELASPDSADWCRRLDRTLAALDDEWARYHAGLGDRLDAVEHRLQLLHPGRRLGEAAQRLDELALRLDAGFSQTLRRLGERLRAAQARLAAAAPARAIAGLCGVIDRQGMRLRELMAAQLGRERARFEHATALLQGLSPLAVLQRGYAIVQDASGAALTDAAATAPGARLDIRLHRGALGVRVEQVQTDEDGS